MHADVLAKRPCRPVYDARYHTLPCGGGGGHNLDRCLGRLGPSGVGQSLFATHLAQLLGRFHAYLDTNIYTDDELWKANCACQGCDQR